MASPLTLAIKRKLNENWTIRNDIERQTRNRNEYWLSIRRNMLASSKFHCICRLTPIGNPSKIVEEMLYPNPNFSNLEPIRHGRISEPLAISQLEAQLQITINNCGLFICNDNDFNFLGASPNGLIDDDGIVEVFCPLKGHNEHPDEAIRKYKDKNLDFFELDNNTNEVTGLKRNSKHYYKIQGGLNITGRNYCIFAMWTGSEYPLKCIRVEKDVEFWEECKPKLKSFYDDYYIVELARANIRDAD